MNTHIAMIGVPDCFEEIKPDFAHCWYFTKSSLNDLLINCGAKYVAIESLGPGEVTFDTPALVGFARFR